MVVSAGLFIVLICCHFRRANVTVSGDNLDVSLWVFELLLSLYGNGRAIWLKIYEEKSF